MFRGREDTLLGRYGLAPEDIEAKSFEIIGTLISETQYSENELQIVKRIVHTTGDPEILEHLRFHPKAISSGVGAIKAGANIYSDVKMAAVGINRQLAGGFGCRIACLIDGVEVVEEAPGWSITRAAAGVRRFSKEFGGSVVAIGNAPTALFALLDLIDGGHPAPALIVGVPVGFVGAAESKAELSRRDLPHITILGTRGGSAIATAVVNALLRLAVAARKDPRKDQ